MNIRKTKIMVDGLNFDLLKRSGKVPWASVRKEYVAMQSYHVVVACAGYTRNAVTSKTLSLISDAPDIRAQHSLLNSESGIG